MSYVCPKCGEPLEVIVRRKGGTSKQVTTLLHRVPQLFQKTATPTFPQSPVIVNQQPAAPTGPLNPGERAYRQLDIQSDVKAVWALAFRAAAPLGPIFVLIGLFSKWTHLWYIWIGGIAVLVAVDALYIIINRDVFIEGLTSKRFRTRERDSEQPITDPNIIHVKAELHEGKRTLYDEFDINDYAAWHKFCKAVHLEDRNFSQTESERHKVPPNDWDTVSREWTRRGWMKQAKRRGTPELRKAGRAWVRAYATTPPQAKG